MNVFWTSSDLLDFSPEFVPDEEPRSVFFAEAIRQMVKGLCIELIQLQGLATPNQAEALCENLDRLLEALRQGPGHWPDMGYDPESCNILAALWANMDPGPSS
jgi:hypothetical protein